MIVVEIAKTLNISRSLAQKLVKRGEFPSAKLNTSQLVNFWEVDEHDVLNFDLSKLHKRGRPRKMEVNK